MAKNVKIYTSDFYCTNCGKKGIPVIRFSGKGRESGHLKKLFCVYCQEEHNHAEVRSGAPYTAEDFKEEFELGRFVDGNKVPIAELISCQEEECKYNRHKKCWNANKSYDCPYRD